MLLPYKCILSYGLTEDELDKIRKRRIRIKDITNFEAGMRIVDLLLGKSNENQNKEYYEELPLNEKALIFNGYKQKDLNNEIKFIRSFVKGGVLAVVTETSNKWTFKTLVEHLIEERTIYEKQQEGDTK